MNSRQELFDELSAWMTAHGWTRRQKAHELRKIFASALVSRSDAYSTQMALGHQDMKTTARYAARPAAAAVDVRNVVRPSNVVVMKEVI